MDSTKNPIVALCLSMEELGASDLFLAQGKPSAMRCNGEVQPIRDFPVLTREHFVDFLEAYLPAGSYARLQTERDMDLGVSLEGARRFRLNLSWAQDRMEMAVRLIPSGALDAEKLGIPQTFLKWMEAPRGLILVTGATGSGKSTTLACMLHYLNRNFRRHVITLEDPIEYVHKDEKSMISQREIGTDTRDFFTALRYAVRQNPDVIFLGEMRDEETVKTAVSAAMTGHLVAATMHTADVARTLERVLSFYSEEQRAQAALDLSVVLKGIVSQRLLQRAEGGGRIPAFEVMENTPLAARLIARQDFGGVAELLKTGEAENIRSFTRAVYALYKGGLVTQESASLAATAPEEFLLLAQGMETGVDAFRSYSADPDHGLSIKKLLRDTIRHNASDLLLSDGAPPMVRVDGGLRAFDMPVLTAADTRKLLYSLLSSRQKADFEERRELDFALSVHGILNLPEESAEEFRFRVNAFFQKGAVAVAFRVIPREIPAVETLGIPPVVMNLTLRKQGLVLVTGPTGSGKSTTIAAMLERINSIRPCHIITVEDPIEFVHEHRTALVEQREVGADTLSFAQALKYVLRQDPDVILVGEMRDVETISAAMTAAETGHLVFATLHTNDVMQTVDRIVDVFPADRQNQIRTQLASCLEAVISQRLLPRMGGGGRVACFEVLMATPAIRAMIREKKTHQIQGQMEASARDGMVTMEHALERLYEARAISRETYELFQPHPLRP